MTSDAAPSRRPAAADAGVAVRAAATMLVALLLLWRAGAVEHAAYATFGAFASVYGGAASPGRWRRQALPATLLTVAVGCGAAVGTLADRGWVSVPVAAGWAAAAAALSDRLRWRPPGPMFLVFAVSTCAAIPAPPCQVATAVLVAAGTAAFAVLLGVAEVGLVSRRRRPRPTPRPPSHRNAGPEPSPHRFRLHAVRCAVAVAVAGSVTTAAGLGHPSWAMTASVVPLSVVSLRRQVARGVHRLAGTVLGLLVAAGLLLPALPVPAVIVLVVACQAAAELLVQRLYAAALVFVTPLALLIAQVADPQPVAALLAARLVETVLGVGVGVAVAVVTRDRSG